VNRIKAIVYGVGAMGRLMTRLMVQKGVDIVGAIDTDPEIVGKDLGAVAGLGRDLNVRVEENAETVLSRRSADIAVVAVASFIEEMQEILAMCATNGKNAISTSEELFYSWTSSPDLTSELDEIAKRNGVSITGCGYQDAYWVNLISVLSGTSHTIDSVVGTGMWNVDDYGPMVAKDAHVGETTDEFLTFIKEQGWPPSFGRNSLESLIADLGLSVAEMQEGTEPETADVDLRCESLDMTVPAGRVIGYTDVVDIRTHQGPTFTMRMIGRLLREGESDINEWIIHGEPEIQLRNEKVQTRTTTCTQMVNRIPDVIAAEPGYVTVERLPKLKYRAYPLHWYLRP
jgi:hypothetical protein